VVAGFTEDGASPVRTRRENHQIYAELRERYAAIEGREAGA
jgi:hypothetical protein